MDNLFLVCKCAIRVHATFSLLVVWISLVGVRGSVILASVAGTLALIQTVCTLVVPHERPHGFWPAFS